MDQTAPARRGTRVGAIWGSAEGAALRRFGCERITPSWDALSSFAHFTRSQGPFLRRHYPATTVIRPRPTPAMAAAFCDVEAATLALDGSPPLTRTTFPTCRAHYPGGSSGCVCRLLPHSYSLRQMAGVSASARYFRGLLRLHSRYGPPDCSVG